MPPIVAIYLRQSKAAEGDELAVDRQLTNCRARATSKGWTVASDKVFVDNNVSASSAKARPAYERMISEVRAGKIDVVIAWNLDRLTRKPSESEEWIELNRQYGVNLLTSEGNDPIDLSTEAGQLILRITIAVARMEADRKARRQRESNVQSRGDGLPPSGRRAFGYTALASGAKTAKATRTTANGTTYIAFGHEPIPAEADVIRRGFDLLLAGASLGSIARQWNEAGLSTTSGAPWTQNTVRGVLTNPRYAALVSPPRLAGSPGHRASRYDLATLTPGAWEPIVSVETWTAASEVLRDPSRRAGSGAPRRWLLSGLATCGVVVDGRTCGAPMKAGATSGGEATYRCSASYHLARKADVVDELIAETVIATLSDPSAGDLLTDQEAPDLPALRSELLARQASLANVAGLVADGTLTPDQARDAVGRLRGQIADVEARMSDAGKVDVLGPVIGSDDVREHWISLPTEIQRSVVSTLMTVSMLSPGRGTRAPRGDAGRLAHTARSVVIERR